MVKMKSMFARFVAAVMVAGAALAAPAASADVLQVFNFNDPVTTGASQAPGVWYTDRYAPAGFQTSGGQLKLTVDSSGAAANRPGAYASTFYDTQGRKLDLAPGTTSLSIEMFISSSFATANQRIGGMWGTGVDGLGNIMSYPILEFASDGGIARFQGWNDDSGWMNYGLATDFAYDTMHTLSFSLSEDKWNYMLDGALLGQVSAFGAVSLDNVILQGVNKFSGDQEQSRTLVFDNLVAANAVPEPTSLALAALGLPLLAVVRRRKSNKS